MESIESIEACYPGLPKDYLSWVEVNGASESTAGYMVYSGPIPAHEIFEELNHNDQIILIADDMAGYTLGFIKRQGYWALVGIDSCDLEIELLEAEFTSYIES